MVGECGALWINLAGAAFGAVPQFIVSVTLGGDLQQDILMQASAQQKQQWYAPTSYAAPVQVPASGNWAGALSGYGAADFFQFPAQANRSLSVIVNALDDSGNVSQGKALPVIGMWALANPGQSPAPANTPSAFNTAFFGATRLDAQILQPTTFRLGIADYRGDGRPDYRYNARVFYGDTLTPVRASVAGGTPLTIEGLGLQSEYGSASRKRCNPGAGCVSHAAAGRRSGRARWRLRHAAQRRGLRRDFSDARRDHGGGGAGRRAANDFGANPQPPSAAKPPLPSP